MDKTSEALFALQPVTFRYKQEIDPSHRLSFGLIAEEVAKVSANLITRDAEGKPRSVRYDAVNAMLLNEFLKEHRKLQKLEVMVARQHKDFEAALADLKEQVQKVSAQLELLCRFRPVSFSPLLPSEAIFCSQHSGRFITSSTDSKSVGQR